MNKPEMRHASPAFLVETMTKRADFLKAARGKRQHTPGFVIQARKRSDLETQGGIRVGYTCSKKVGNAVARNRAKRRLREVARAIIPSQGKIGFDYVFIGRAHETSNRDFSVLLDDLSKALKILHPK